MANLSTPSSSTSGFFQKLPTLEPQYTSPDPTINKNVVPDDAVLGRILRQYIPSGSQGQVGRDMHNMSRTVLEPSTLKHAVEAETTFPYLQPFNTFGEVNQNDPLVLCNGWKSLKRIGIESGVVALAHDKSITLHNRRVHQFLVNHNWSHTATMTTCPLMLTDGAIGILSNHLDDHDGDQGGRRSVMAEFYRRMTTTDPNDAWTSGQWMTERSGGSDVRGTETLARKITKTELDAEGGQAQDSIGQPLGPWVIDGFKWFSSATDSDMAMLLAETPSGLSAFCVPMRRKCANGTQMNGIRIQRLKNKLGTKGLPTGELELIGTRGWLLGEEGKGVKEISTILNITRLHAGASSASFWARGLAVSRAYTKSRKVRGDFLYENSQHNYWMAAETVKYWAATTLTFFGVALLGCEEQGPRILSGTPASFLIPDGDTSRNLLRLLTPVIKSQVSLAAVSGLRSTIECLGGVGYCENHEDGGIMNLAKLFRDSVVNTIWEGTTSIMADDAGRVLKDKRIAGGRIIEDVFSVWVRRVLEPCRPRFTQECKVLDERLQVFLDLVADTRKDAAQLEYQGRDLLDHLEVLATGTLLLHDANTDGDEISSHIATRYVWSRAIPGTRLRRVMLDWKSESAIDLKIFLGSNGPVKRAHGRL